MPNKIDLNTKYTNLSTIISILLDVISALAIMLVLKLNIIQTIILLIALALFGIKIQFTKYIKE